MEYNLTHIGYINLAKELVKLNIEKNLIESRTNEIIEILDKSNLIEDMKIKRK